MHQDVKRVDNTILPDPAELAYILETEVKRDLPPETKESHFPKFEIPIQLFAYFGLPTTIFINDSLNIHDVVAQGKLLLDELVKAILSRPLQKSEIDLFDSAYEYLSEQDQPQPSDLIFIFGAKTPLRAEKAAELYREGLAKKIMVSGGNPVYSEKPESSEAQQYKEILIGRGVPDEDIIVEDKAITVPDNVRRSLNLLEEMQVNYRGIILVNSPYTQRRGWAIFKKHLPRTVALYRVNSGAGEQYAKDNWYKQENTLRVVLNEFLKMRSSVVYNTA